MGRETVTDISIEIRASRFVSQIPAPPPAYRRENRAEIITRPLVMLRSPEDGEKTVDGEGLRLDGVIMPLSCTPGFAPAKLLVPQFEEGG